jgi:hypothetical protein
MPDVDIDFANREQALKLFKHVPAAIIIVAVLIIRKQKSVAILK